MAFVKGQSGNPKGREKGSKNRATTELRDFFRDLLEQNREQIVKDLAAIDPLDVQQRLLYNKLDELCAEPGELAIESPDDTALLDEGADE